MKKFSVVLALVCAMVLVLGSVSAADQTIGVTPSTDLVITQDDYSGDTVSLTFSFDETSAWNDWCPAAVKVTKDGSDYYYVVAGAQVTWDVSVEYEEIDGTLVGSVISPNSEDSDLDGEWISVNAGDVKTLDIDVSDATEWSIRVLCIAWCADDSCTVEDPDGTTKDLTYGDDNTPTDHVFTLTYSSDAAAEETADDTAAETTADDSAASAQTADAMNVVMIAGLAVVALAGAVVVANKKNA